MLSLLRLERKQNISSNPFRIRIFLFLSYSFGIKTINTFIHSRSSLENTTRFQPVVAAHIYRAYIREYPPPPLRAWGLKGGSFGLKRRPSFSPEGLRFSTPGLRFSPLVLSLRLLGLRLRNNQQTSPSSDPSGYLHTLGFDRSLR